MATGIMKCRVCGKKYEGCRTTSLTGVFRWQNVACSPECGEIYLHDLRVARGEIVERVAEKKPEPKKVVAEVVEPVEEAASQIEDLILDAIEEASIGEFDDESEEA